MGQLEYTKALAQNNNTDSKTQPTGIGMEKNLTNQQLLSNSSIFNANTGQIITKGITDNIGNMLAAAGVIVTVVFF